MRLSVYIGWGLAIPGALSLVYGVIVYRAMGVLGYYQKDTVWARIRAALPALILFTLWGMADIPLPLVYILAFFGKMIQLMREKGNRERELLIIYLTHVMTIALHLILIGVFSLILQMPMNEILQSHFFRIITISIVLAVNNLTAWLVSKWEFLLSVLRTQSDSEEVKPFLVFLLFCNFFLLLDSVLCIARIDWKLLPVFLIGSTVLLEFYLIAFLRNLYILLKVRYLEEEYRNLMDEMERRNRAAAKLRSRSAVDSLTGIYSRRYVTEQASFLLESKVPFSFVFIDLDHLKQINDQEGHHAGDLYLKRFAEEFGLNLRKLDVFARVGGDEFAVLLPGCAEETAKKRIGEIRTMMEQELSPPLSFSFGVAYSPKESKDSMETVFRMADEEMYRDKQKRIK